MFMPLRRDARALCDLSQTRCLSRRVCMTVTAEQQLDEAWRQHRHYVLDIAFRMLGDIGDAEDVVQETYLRLLRTGTAEIDDLRGWLVVVASRLCVDQLRSARVRHGAPVAPPETVGREIDPADRVTL